MVDPNEGSEWRRAYQDAIRQLDEVKSDVRDLQRQALPVTVARIEENVKTLVRDHERSEKEREREAERHETFRADMRKRMKDQEDRDVGDDAVTRKNETVRSRVNFLLGIAFGFAGVITAVLAIVVRG